MQRWLFNFKFYVSLLPSTLVWICICRWFRGAPCVSYDLAGIYYGMQSRFICRQCITVYRQRGAKWRVVYNFLHSPQWSELAARSNYSAIMVCCVCMCICMCVKLRVCVSLHMHKWAHRLLSINSFWRNPSVHD
jgi:hypothetical protein